MNSYIIYALLAVVLYTIYMAVVHLFRSDRIQQKLDSGQTFHAELQASEEPSAGVIFCENVVRMTGVDPGAQKELTALLAQAGLNSPHAVVYYLFFRRIVQPILLVVGGLLFVKLLVFSGRTTGMGKIFNFLLALIMLFAGLFGAKTYVTNLKQRRQKILLHSFPELMDLLLVCIESGLGLDAALARVCKEMQVIHPVISQELERTRLELTMLADRSQALQNLAERTEIVPFKSLVSSLIQTEKFGTSLVDTLRVLSEDQRATRLLQAENRAARLPVLITIPVILFVFMPFFLAIILGPPIVRVMAQGGIFGAHTTKR